MNVMDLARERWQQQALDDREQRGANRAAAEHSQEVADLRDAIRLIIGREWGVPWSQVSQTEVDAYVEAVRKLKVDQGIA